MKKTICLGILLICSICVHAQEFSKKKLLYRVNSTDLKTVELIGFEKKPTEEVEIPIEVSYKGDKYIISSIGIGAFKDCETLIKVTGQTIQEIKESAFDGCKNLTCITFSDQLSIVGKKAFNNCASLTEMSLGNNVKDIGDMAFNNCFSLTHLSLGNALRNIGANIINGTKISTIVLPGSLKKIGNNAFAEYQGLTSVTLDDGITDIGEKAFAGTSISALIFPNSLISIGDNSFDGCASLQTINFGNSIKKIGKNAFTKATISSISFPNSLEDIDENAFTDCVRLSEVVFGSNLRRIGKGAFARTNVEKIVFPASLKEILPEAFLDCKKLQVISLNDDILIKEKAFAGCSMLSVDLSDVNCDIAVDAFDNCKNVIQCKYSLKGLKNIIENENFDIIRSFFDGFAFVKKNSKVGFIDMKGNVAIPLQYEDASNFINGYATVKQDGKWCIIEKSGNKILPEEYDGIKSFTGKYAIVSNNKKYGVIDMAGNYVIPMQDTEIIDIKEDMIRMDGKYLYMDGREAFNIPSRYVYVGSFSEGLADVANENEKYGFIDKTGKEVIPCVYDTAKPFYNGYSVVTTSETFKNDDDMEISVSFIIDKQGIYRATLRYDETGWEYGDYFPVSKGGIWGYINKSNKMIIPLRYNSAKSFHGDYAIVHLNNGYGCINKRGEVIIPFNYEKLNNFHEGLALAQKDGRFGFINEKGKSTFDNK